MHEIYMKEAIIEAKKALELREVPVGAVVVLGDQIIGRGFNQRETLGDPTAHAEMIAIRAAAEFLGSWRLTNTRLYVTLEPCPMCAGAIVNARIDSLIYGAVDPKSGAVSSLMNLVQDERLNHRVEVTAGICRETCSQMLKDFFAGLRKRNK
ncbi:MAG: tRNA adenosine(34) deaminase TadA [Candidatus Wallacebacter cryptica]|jgi:tRNA(adenine34) deaminase|nr:tRNA adenosine(34) deaminase TadA [Bacillota bacterium]